LFQARDPLIHGVTFQDMLAKFMPCSDKTKKNMIQSMGQLGTIVSDDTVHMLMVALVLFDSQDIDMTVRWAHNVTINMLRGYLEANTSYPEMELQTVLKSVKDVPLISAARNKLLLEMFSSKPSIKKQRIGMGNSEWDFRRE
jgi:hypothetical protein